MFLCLNLTSVDSQHIYHIICHEDISIEGNLSHALMSVKRRPLEDYLRSKLGGRGAGKLV